MSQPSPVIMAGPLPAKIIRPTEVQLFRFSAATWNPHRIHFDLPYAQSEGFPGLLVQSHLHASWLAAYALDHFGGGATLRRFSWRNRAIAIPADILTLQGNIVESTPTPEGERIQLTLSTTNLRGEQCVSATAHVVLPTLKRAPQ